MIISDKIQIAILIVTFLVAIATFISTYLTFYSINLSARPTLKIEATSISLSPAILLDNNNVWNMDKKDRYTISITLRISNIGPNPAQDISVDGEVFFKNSKPYGYTSLPVHLPEHYNILESKPINQNEIKTSINFDNYVAKQILIDHINPKEGLAFLPYKKEFLKKKLWPSPKLKVKCYYSDIQKNYYRSEIDLFFHGYKDNEKCVYCLMLLNMFDLNFARVRKISKFTRDRALIKIRHKRHISFSGVDYSKNELLTLVLKNTTNT